MKIASASKKCFIRAASSSPQPSQTRGLVSRINGERSMLTLHLCCKPTLGSFPHKDAEPTVLHRRDPTNIAMSLAAFGRENRSSQAFSSAWRLPRCLSTTLTNHFILEHTLSKRMLYAIQIDVKNGETWRREPVGHVERLSGYPNAVHD